jgi:hypothetical protein
MRRIKEQDYEALFAYGECFRFALRLHDRWGYKIRGIRAALNKKDWGHVWAVRCDGKGIDIRGIYPEKLLALLANDGIPATPDDVYIQDVDVQEVRDVIEARKYPQEVSAELDDLADKIVDTRERFRGAKPTNKCLREFFEGDKEASEQEAAKPNATDCQGAP